VAYERVKPTHMTAVYSIYGLYTAKQFLYRPGQAWTGPEGSRRLRLPDFKTIGV